MKTRFIGMPVGAVPVFWRPPGQVWLYDDTQNWITTGARKMFVTLHLIDVGLDATPRVRWGFFKRLVLKAIQPLLPFEDEGTLTVVYSLGGLDQIGLVFSEVALSSARRVCTFDVVTKPPSYWNATV